MPTYITKSLKRYAHPSPQNPHYVPPKWTVKSHGQSTKYVKGPENTPRIDKKITKDI